MSLDDFISREKILGDSNLKRVHYLLFLIEAQTSYLVRSSRVSLNIFGTSQNDDAREEAYLAAFSHKRQVSKPPTIQQLELFAGRWANLVPQNASLRAALAHLLSQKYRFSYKYSSGLRGALGLDQPEVAKAYERSYKQSLTLIYTTNLSLKEKLVWRYNWLGQSFINSSALLRSLILTVITSLPFSLVALPIAVAGIGPLAGAALVGLVGLFNILTMFYMARATLNSGTIHYSRLSPIQLCENLLGRAGVLLFILTIAILLFLGVLVTLTGLTNDLYEFTGIPTWFWPCLFFAGSFVLLAWRLTSLTLNLSLGIGSLCLALTFVLIVIALLNFRLELLLTYNPFATGQAPLNLALLGPVLGAVIILYPGHGAITTNARLILERDQDGWAFTRGVALGTLLNSLLSIIWILVINGAISAQELRSENGTVIAPLFKVAGPVAGLLGEVLVLFLLFRGFLETSTGLFELVEKRLPEYPWVKLYLPRRKGKIVLTKKSLFSSVSGGNPKYPTLALIYLGLQNGQARFWLEIQFQARLEKLEFTIEGSRWEAKELLTLRPDLAAFKLDIRLEIEKVSQENIILALASSLKPHFISESDSAGLNLFDLLFDDPIYSKFYNWLGRQPQGATVKAIAAYLSLSETQTLEYLNKPLEEGLIRHSGSGKNLSYKTSFTPRRPSQLDSDFWRKLQAKPHGEPILINQGLSASYSSLNFFTQLINKPKVRFCLALGPGLFTILVVEFLIFTSNLSFTHLLEFTGIVAHSLIAGIFPALLFLASLGKGERYLPGKIKFLENRLICGIIAFIALVNLLLHGLFIWSTPFEQICSLLTGVVVLATIFYLIWTGAFKSRMLLELREEQKSRETLPGQLKYRLSEKGQNIETEITFDYEGKKRVIHSAEGELSEIAKLSYISFQFTLDKKGQLEIWAHTITPEGFTLSLDCLIEVRQGNRVSQFDPGLSGSQIICPVEENTECNVFLFFDQVEENKPIRKS